MVSIDCGSFISGDVGINEAGWGWFVIYICGDSEQTSGSAL